MKPLFFALLLACAAPAAMAAEAPPPVQSVTDIARAPESANIDSQVNKGLDALGPHRPFKFAEALKTGATSVDAKTSAFAAAGGKWAITIAPSVSLTAQTPAEVAHVCEPASPHEGFKLTEQTNTDMSNDLRIDCVAVYPSDGGKWRLWIKAVRYLDNHPITVLVEAVGEHGDPAQAQAFIERLRPSLDFMANMMATRLTMRGGH